MKKFIAIFLLCLMIPLSLTAGSLFEFSLGATSAYQKADAIKEISEGNFNISDVSIDDFKFGADVNINLFLVNINGKTFFNMNNDKVNMSGIVSANLLLNFSLIRLKAGLGYQYTIDPTTLIVKFGSANTVSTFEDFKDANFDIYAGVDIALGKVLIGAYATLPTGTTINNGKWVDLFTTVKDNWKAAQLGISVSYAFL